MEVCIYCLSLLPLFVGILCWVFVCGVVLSVFYSFVLILMRNERAGPKVIKLFSCSPQLRTKFQLLLKTKISTNKEVSCFKSLRCCIYLANKC